MHLLAIGLNHTTAPVSVRERVAFGPEEIAETIGHMRERFSSTQMGGIHEAAILSTCNRTEIYCAAEDTDAARDSVLGFICERKNVSRSELEPHIYTFTQEEAAKHTFRVASGLDSMVLGETQIVGQMKKAEKMARDAHGLGTMLNHLFQSTFTVAKEVRTATAIGANSVSLAAAAVRLALRLFGSLKDERVLFVGAGEMIELCAAHFAAQQPKSITIANRTLERGQVLARTVHADAIRLADLPEKIEDTVMAQLTGEQRKLYLANQDRIAQQVQHREAFEFKKDKLKVLAELTKQRQICCDPHLHYEDYKAGSAKLDACMELVHGALDGGHHILVFSQFTGMLDIIGKRLAKEDIGFLKLTGASSKESRAKRVAQFQAGEVPVFLISLKAGGVGLNLTAADVVIHYDPWWNVAAQDQATDRAHRIGQQHTVTVYKLIAKDTIEERIMQMQESKRDLVNSVLGGDGISSALFTREDVLALLGGDGR